MSFNHELLFCKDTASTAKMWPAGYPFLKSVRILYCPVVSSWMAIYFWPLFWVWFLFPLQQLNKSVLELERSKTSRPCLFSQNCALTLDSQQWEWVMCMWKGLVNCRTDSQGCLTPVPHRLQWELRTYVLCQMWAHLEQTLFPAI